MTKKIDFKAQDNSSIIQYALSPDPRKYWDAVAVLHERGGREIFLLAEKLCKSSAQREQSLGADILGQLGWRKDEFRAESISALMALLQVKDLATINSAAVALGHRQAKEAVSRLAALSAHRSRQVRFGVVFGLLGQDDDVAINALIDLSSDKVADIRNWATFGLGSNIARKSAEIERALVARLNDNDIETRGEALLGLALRKHPQAVSWVEAALSRDDVIVLNLEAAAALGDKAVLPALLKLKNDPEPTDQYFVRCLDEAIEACSM